MYQKTFSEVDSVVPSKGLPFMDRMYMKIEAICVEADKNPSLMFQEAGKYFENQVSTVGANMRKLCSEFIRDLLPPPEEELTECKHVEKCQCRCEADKNKCKNKSKKVLDDPAPKQAKENSITGPESHEDQAAPATGTSGRGLSSEVLQVEENDTEVEADEQVAQWYVTDEYRKTSGIMENWDGNLVSTSKGDSDSEWEVL